MSSPSPGRSTRARTRSSGTSSPSGCSVCPRGGADGRLRRGGLLSAAAPLWLVAQFPAPLSGAAEGSGRVPLMHFLLDAEQRAFAGSLDAMLAAAHTSSVVRDWSRGEHTSGRSLWSRLADAGVFALAVPEEYGGLGPRPVELAVAFVELGRHAVPGPMVETVAAAALLGELSALGEPGPAERLLPGLASGKSLATLVLPGSPAPAAGVSAPSGGPTPD